MKKQPKNRNSLRWFNEKYADLTAEELIEKYNVLFDKKRHMLKHKSANTLVKLFFKLKRPA